MAFYYDKPLVKAHYDAFGRQRVSEAKSLFDGQFTYDTQPLLFEKITSGTGASISHDANNSACDLSFSSTSSGGVVAMQTYDFFRYQPGKSQLIYVTFNMRGGVAGVEKYAGYTNGANNGVEFVLIGTTPAFRIRSGTDKGDITVMYNDWNNKDVFEKEVGALNTDKTQILVIDLEALYVGKVRIGFDINGKVYYLHEFNHSNNEEYPYIQTANLPVRVGMTNTTTATTSMLFVCCAVMSEAGRETNYGYQFSAINNVSALNGTRTHLLTIQPKQLFNGRENRSSIEILGFSFMNTGNTEAIYEIVLGQTITSPTVVDVNSTYSAIEKVTGGTLDGDPVIVVDGGYIPASVQSKDARNFLADIKYPITLDSFGNQRDLGRLTVLAQGIGAATDVYGSVYWREIR